MIRFFNVYYPTRAVVLLLCEIVLIGACVLGAVFYVLGPDADLALNYEYGYLKLAGVVVLTIGLSYYFDLYEPQLLTSRFDIYFRLLCVLGFDCLLISAAAWLFPEVSIAEHVYLVAFVLMTAVLLVWRHLYSWIVSHKLFRERIFVLGAGNYARSIVETIQVRRDLGMEVIAWEDVQLEQQHRKNYWINSLEKLAKDERQPHRIIVAMDGARGELPVEELLQWRFRGIVVEEVGTLRERLSGKIQIDGLRPSSLLYSEGFRIRPSQQFTRQVVSTVAAAVGLLLFLPFFPIVMLMVRLSSRGPIFFRQSRVGQGGRAFNVIKFRTMFTDAEASGAKWAVKGDTRVTGIGKFMRKTRLDEVPQLWNVLRGDMGFVGPRPERPEFIPWLTEQIPFYELRQLIRPGLTGWAQVRYGYGATLAETREKLEYDLYYIKHMSLGLDLMIMFETVKTIIRRRGAQ